MKKLAVILMTSLVVTACTTTPKTQAVKADNAQLTADREDLVRFCKVHEGKVTIDEQGAVSCTMSSTAPNVFDKTLNEAELRKARNEFAKMMIKGDTLPKEISEQLPK